MLLFQTRSVLFGIIFKKSTPEEELLGLDPLPRTRPWIFSGITYLRNIQQALSQHYSKAR